MALAVPSAQPEAGLIFLLMRSGDLCEMGPSGDLRFSTMCKELLWLPAPSQLARAQESAPSWMEGCARALQTLPQVDTKTNDTKWHQDFFRAGNGQLVQPQVQVLVFVGPLGQQWASPKIVCQESKISGFYRFAFFYCARFHAKVGINVVM